MYTRNTICNIASLKSRMCRGYKYWYIVESRRVNGKPLPIVIECLGTTQNLIDKLQGLSSNQPFKPFSHGAVAALLNLAKNLDIVSIINKYTSSKRKNWPKKPILNGLKAGWISSGRHRKALYSSFAPFL